MGGDAFSAPVSSTEVELSLGDDFSHDSIKTRFSSGDHEDCLNTKLEDNGSVVVKAGAGLNFGELDGVGPRYSSVLEAKERQRCKVYDDVLRSYEELQSRIERLEEAKSKVLSYTPGSLVEKVGGLEFCDYNVPETTSLLLIGPKGCGKSSLVNKISRVFENEKFASERAQISYNPSSGDGTCFLHEYKIPRDSGSFCVYDTRSLSDDQSENLEMVKGWMTKGVRHGQMVMRESDSNDIKAHLALKCRARHSSCFYACVRSVNFIIFVVNGLSVLESMDGDDETKKQYSQLIVTSFNNPLLAFKDDKPVVVVTHGDLLSLSDRSRIRVYLGELLGVPPKGQIFDIPEIDDSVTNLTVVDMLNFCLERADRNLPVKADSIYSKDQDFVNMVCVFMPILLIIVCMVLHHRQRSPMDSSIKVDWHKIRHLW